MKESARYILQILVFVALILSVGTVGYMLIEDDIKLGDAFYMTVTAITPTQFDEIHKLSMPGRYFTVVLVFCGFGAVVAFATQFARLVIQSELEGVGVFTRKQMRRRIKRMKNHYIVCGFGEIGDAICSELKAQQLPFVVVASDEASLTAIEREGYAIVKGNPTADASLKEAEIDRAFGVIAVLPDDADNLFISLAARELNPKILIIARGEDSAIESRMLRAGADIVVSPMKLGGRQIAGLIKQQMNTSMFHAAPTGKTILLADDHRALRLLFARKLAGAGHEVIQAAAGDEALSKIYSHHPDLIVLDVNMPQRSGYEVCSAIRKNPQFENIPVILYSGEETAEFIQLGRQAGATLCLRKTSKSSELLAGIEEVFLKQKSLAEGKIQSSCSEDQLEVLAATNGRDTPSAEPFDKSLAMENVEGDRQLLHELVHLMLEDTPHIMQRLQQAIVQRDSQAIRLEAHSLKSSVAILGAQQAADVAAQMESAGQHGELENVDTLHKNLTIRIEELMGALENQFSQPTP